MKKLLLLLPFLLFFSCNASQKAFPIGEEIVISKNLKIIPITENVFIHISYLEIPNYGPFPCNGMIYKNKKAAYVFDTPTNNETSKELIEWLKVDQKLNIKGVVINHFHVDCLGGLQAFHNENIPSYANKKTSELAKTDSSTIPQFTFEKTQILRLGNQKVINTYFGQAHTKDNILSWLPAEQVIFGGCMVKSLKAGKGNLADANVKEWSNTVQKVKNAYSDARFVIPGHGQHGDISLLDYTIEKFSASE